MFEVIDHTSGEVYYPVGTFPSLEIAVNEIEKFLKSHGAPPLSAYSFDDHDCCEIHIREHNYGWGEPKTVWKKEWRRTWSDDEDDGTWQEHKPAKVSSS